MGQGLSSYGVGVVTVLIGQVLSSYGAKFLWGWNLQVVGGPWRYGRKYEIGVTFRNRDPEISNARFLSTKLHMGILLQFHQL